MNHCAPSVDKVLRKQPSVIKLGQRFQGLTAPSSIRKLRSELVARLWQLTVALEADPDSSSARACYQAMEELIALRVAVDAQLAAPSQAATTRKRPASVVQLHRSRHPGTCTHDPL